MNKIIITGGLGFFRNKKYEVGILYNDQDLKIK
jgi:hypothetical protein